MFSVFLVNGIIFFYCFTYTTYNVILTLPTLLTLITILTLDTLLTLRYITVLNTTIAKKVLTDLFSFFLNNHLNYLLLTYYLFNYLNVSFSFFSIFIKHTRTQLHTCTRKIHSFMFGGFT